MLTNSSTASFGTLVACRYRPELPAADVQSRSKMPQCGLCEPPFDGAAKFSYRSQREFPPGKAASNFLTKLEKATVVRRNHDVFVIS